MNIIDIANQNSIKNATEVLCSSGVLVFPTDTVYGIGCLPKEESIQKLYKIKNRQNQPTAILISGKIFKEFQANVLNSIDTEKLNQFNSGRLTLIVHIKKTGLVLPEIILKNNTIGVRMPKYRWLEELIDEVGPIVASSANKAGERASKCFKELDQQIIEETDLVIKTDELLGGLPSSIYNLETSETLR